MTTGLRASVFSIVTVVVRIRKTCSTAGEMYSTFDGGSLRLEHDARLTTTLLREAAL